MKDPQGTERCLPRGQSWVRPRGARRRAAALAGSRSSLALGETGRKRPNGDDKPSCASEELGSGLAINQPGFGEEPKDREVFPLRSPADC